MAWCQTEKKLKYGTFKWTIKNFSFFKNLSSETIISSYFSVKDLTVSAYKKPKDGASWLLHLTTRFVDAENGEEYVSLHLQAIQSTSSIGYHIPIKAQCKFSLIDKNQQETHMKEIPKPEEFHDRKMAGFKFFIKWSTLLEEANTLLPEDTLTIFCNLTLMSGAENISGENSKEDIIIPDSSVKENFRKLYNNPKFHDFIVSVGDEEFKVHKAVLWAQNDIFAKMLDYSDLEESKKNRVEITDITSEVMREVLRFIYCDDCDQKILNNLADEILIAADKYNLKRLKAMCESTLFEKLTINNAIDTFILADIGNAAQLKNKVLNFITKHTAEVMKTSGYDSLLTLPSLLKDLLHAVVQPQG